MQSIQKPIPICRASLCSTLQHAEPGSPRKAQLSSSTQGTAFKATNVYEHIQLAAASKQIGRPQSNSLMHLGQRPLRTAARAPREGLPAALCKALALTSAGDEMREATCRQRSPFLLPLQWQHRASAASSSSIHPASFLTLLREAPALPGFISANNKISVQKKKKTAFKKCKR